MIGISFYLYEVGSARAPKGFPPWWTAGMKASLVSWKNSLGHQVGDSIFGAQRALLSSQDTKLSEVQLWSEQRSVFTNTRYHVDGLKVGVPT